MEPVEYKGKLEGKSNAHLISFSDGNEYVVKYFQKGFEKSLANEWVAYCLARYMGVPVPYGKIVEIPESFSTAFLREETDRTKCQFASLYIPGCLNGHEVKGVTRIINQNRLASIILFDYWLMNRDRTRKNILYEEKRPGAFRLWAIDHAEVFNSYNWALEDLYRLPEEGLLKSATHRMIAKHIEEEEEFFSNIDLIQKMPTHLIEEIIDMIPDDWAVSKEEKKAMVGILIHRRKKIVPHLIERFIDEIYRTVH